MTPTEQAKQRVSEIFAALRAYPADACWHERVRGGFHASAGITGGILVADVGYDGEFAVYAGKTDHSCDRPLKPGAICLISGSCAPHVATQVSNRPEDAIHEESPTQGDSRQ